jgi:hypothetical protein
MGDNMAVPLDNREARMRRVIDHVQLPVLER